VTMGDEDIDFPRPATASAGDSLERLGAAYQEHVRRLLQVVAGVVGNWALAEDIVQDVFLGLLRSPSALGDGEVALRARLIVRARSRAIDLYRADEARRRNENRNITRAALDRETADEGAVAAGARDLRDALRVLPDDQLQPIILAYFAGHTYREVADQLDLPEGTVKARIRTGLQRLRVTLAENLEEA
jgi:RNA polymerase sigma-70 factor (ECF subfamily)